MSDAMSNDLKKQVLGLLKDVFWFHSDPEKLLVAQQQLCAIAEKHGFDPKDYVKVAEFAETALGEHLTFSQKEMLADLKLNAVKGQLLARVEIQHGLKESKPVVENIEKNLKHSSNRGLIIGGIAAAVGGLGYGLYEWDKQKTHKQRENDRRSKPATERAPG